MLLPILFLFITGGITQEWCWSDQCAPAPAQAQAQAQAQTQTETTDQKLDRILASIEQKNDYANGRARNRAVEHTKLKDELDNVILAANGFNQTLNHLLEENETLRKRQAAAAAISVSQLLIVIIYLLMIGVSYLVKCFKKQQEKQLVENLELMESRLQERKNKRRSAARSSPKV